jgi:hypothetical protein
MPQIMPAITMSTAARKLKMEPFISIPLPHGDQTDRQLRQLAYWEAFLGK